MSSSTAIEFGLINTLRTHNLLVDALLCMIVPVLIQRLMAAVQASQTSLFTMLKNLFFPPKKLKYVTREIVSSQRFNRYGLIWDDEQKSKILQKALAAYLGDVIDLHNKSARCGLTDKPKNKDKLKASESGEHDSALETKPLTAADKLVIEDLPLLGEWIEVKKGIEFRQEDSTTDSQGEDKSANKIKENTVKYVLRSSLKDGTKRIDALIEKAFSQYQERDRTQNKKDKARYFYLQAGTKASQYDANQQVVAYKRYALGEEKTFENLFFDDKPQVLSLLDDFMGKTGKFAIRGFPYKLGFLLHGPPGTGKTSLIKAIAQYTKRHIVTINLSKIKSNQELMDAVFDLKFAVQDRDMPITLTFKNVVFVMEDIDAASKIVTSRKLEQKESKRASLQRAQSKKKVESHADDLDDVLMETMVGPAMKPKEDNDKLNLSGLLNVLDGVIDCPGRIVIMTTNHPESLDAALIRPGRVNKMLLLSHMNANGAQEMIEYYCQTKLTESQKRRVDDVFDGNLTSRKPLTPAQVEEFCAEKDDADSVIEALEKHVHLRGDVVFC